MTKESANINGPYLSFKPECFVCWVRRSLEAISRATDDRNLQLEVIKQVTKPLMDVSLNEFVEFELVEGFFRLVKEASGREDTYSTVKTEFNRKAIALYPALKDRVAKSEDRLLTAMLIAAAGNIFDEASGLNFDLEESIESALRIGFKHADYQEFKDSLYASKRILYIADNAGEIVFDRLLIEEIGDHQVTCVVKGVPIGTDATIEDAISAGIDVANVVATEAGHPLKVVGSSVKKLEEALSKTDMIISKGNLNHEVLIRQLERSAFYIFKIKCNNMRESLTSRGNFEMGDVVLIKQ